jgi:single-strand DNA-binding protein
MASSLNRAQLIGNLTADPELRQTTSGQAVCSFSIATNRTWTNQQGEKQEQADYHNVVAWGRLAEICSQYLMKGKKVFIEGRLQTRDWEGQDGVKRYRTEIVAENMIMLDRPTGQQGGGRAQGNYGSPAMQDAPAGNPDDEIKLEDIPF